MSLPFLRAVALSVAALSAAGVPLAGDASAQEQPPVRIGYAISRTGAFAGGAQVTQEPNYILWAEQVNAAGGLSVKGEKRKVVLIGYDDGSKIDNAVRIYERLMTEENVDLILPPWGTGMTFAVALVANRHRYPLLAPTALSRQLIDMRMPYFFSVLQQSDQMMKALVDMLVERRVKSVGVVFMLDHFGFENVEALSRLLEAAAIPIVERRSYSPGIQDMSPILRSMKQKNVDAFIGITYPPETILVSRQAREIGFNPKAFYASVGTAFPLYKHVVGSGAEYVLGMGSWNSKTSPGARRYFEAHLKRFQREPDRWASGHTWAALEVLQQAVEKVGLDRLAIRDYIADNEFQTIIGRVRFRGGENVATPGTIGQWQKGEFEVVWPMERATAAVVYPKPGWPKP